MGEEHGRRLRAGGEGPARIGGRGDCGAWDCVNGFLWDLDRLKEEKVGGFIRQRHVDFFGEDAPADVPLPLLRLKMGYFLQRRGFERTGGLAELSPEFLQNYRAAMDLNPDRFTPEMRELLALDMAAEHRAKGGQPYHKKSTRHSMLQVEPPPVCGKLSETGSRCACGNPKREGARLCPDCAREHRRETFRAANRKRGYGPADIAPSPVTGIAEASRVSPAKCRGCGGPLPRREEHKRGKVYCYRCRMSRVKRQWAEASRSRRHKKASDTPRTKAENAVRLADV